MRATLGVGVCSPSQHLETILSARDQRDLDLLKLAEPLSRYARALQPDPNEAYLLVHNALQAAFASDPRHARPSEATLRRHIERDFAQHG